MNKSILLAVSTLLVAAGTSASAAIVTSLPGGVALTLPASQFSSGPVVFSGVTYTSTNNSVLGYTGGYGFSSNGFWNGTPPMIGLDTGSGTFTLVFATPLSGFLGQLNWTVGFSGGNGTVQAYDAGGTLLETLTVENGANAATPNGYYGFSRTAGDIAKITFSNEYIGVRDITTIAGAAVPEPASWAMLIAGFGLTGAAMRRRRSVAVAA